MAAAKNVERFSSLFGGGSVSDDIKNEIEIIKSTPVLTRVVQKWMAILNTGPRKISKTQNIYKASPFNIVAEHISDSTKSFALEMILQMIKVFR